MGGSYYLIPCSILSTGKDRKTSQRYPDVPTSSWRIFIRSMNSRTIDQSAGGKLRDLNPEESWAILEDLALYDNESWNDPRDFVKPVKAIALPQDVPSTSDRRLIELENQVQRLMEAHLAPTQPTQVNKITTPCDICSGPHDTRHCMENPEQAFVEYASSRTDEAGEGTGFQFHGNLRRRLSKFEADFKQQQSEMTNKIDTVLKAITDRITGTLLSDTVKNPKLETHPVSSTRSHPTMDPQCSIQVHSSINTITIHPKQPEKSQVNEPKMELEKKASETPTLTHNHINLLVPQSSNTKFVYSNEDDGEVMFIEIIRDDDEPQNKDPNEGEGATIEEPVVEYFNTFPTRNELTYYRLYLMRRSLEVLRKFHWMILEGRFNQLLHVSSPLLSKPGEY
ncbi:hypothetical protein Tco_1053998 [Tanacetum coccineum]|uniref:MAK10-like protein n=1 Tax=Tanacetum coccineum TaxID=301880 RepID=A0ABQ5GVG7_9ASTR